MAITISWCRLSTSCFLYSRWSAESYACPRREAGSMIDQATFPIYSSYGSYRSTIWWHDDLAFSWSRKSECDALEVNWILYSSILRVEAQTCSVALQFWIPVTSSTVRKSCREAFTCIHLRGWQKIPQNMKDSTSSTTMIPNHLGWCASIFEEGVISFAILTCFCPCQSSL